VAPDPQLAVPVPTTKAGWIALAGVYLASVVQDLASIDRDQDVAFGSKITAKCSAVNSICKAIDSKVIQ
jgi:hypothetical protein